MKKRLFLQLISFVCLSLLAGLSNSLFAQPSNTDITGVKNVEFSLACEVTLLQGEKASLIITGDDDELEDVKIKMNGTYLEVYNNSHHQHKDDVKITITVPDLNKLSLSGVVDIETPEIVKFNDLKLDVSGVAEIDFKLQSTNVEIDASGVLTARIVGATRDLDVEISGVGKLNASDLKAENCHVEVSGVAKASVYATEKLNASVSGMGRINYAGHPLIHANSSGFGSISRL